MLDLQLDYIEDQQSMFDNHIVLNKYCDTQYNYREALFNKA